MFAGNEYKVGGAGETRTGFAGLACYSASGTACVARLGSMTEAQTDGRPGGSVNGYAGRRMALRRHNGSVGKGKNDGDVVDGGQWPTHPATARLTCRQMHNPADVQRIYG